MKNDFWIYPGIWLRFTGDVDKFITLRFLIFDRVIQKQMSICVPPCTANHFAETNKLIVWFVELCAVPHVFSAAASSDSTALYQCCCYCYYYVFYFIYFIIFWPRYIVPREEKIYAMLCRKMSSWNGHYYWSSYTKLSWSKTLNENKDSLKHKACLCHR